VKTLLGVAGVIACSVVAGAACGGKTRVIQEEPQARAGRGGEAGRSAPAAGEGGEPGAGGTLRAGGAPGVTAGSGGGSAGFGGGRGGRETSGGMSSASGRAGAGGTSAGSDDVAGGDGGTEGGGEGGAPSGPGFGLPGSTGDCPPGPVVSGATCDLKGVICGYLFESAGEKQYQECACARNAAGAVVWNCYPTGARAESCPDVGPEHETDCSGLGGISCPVPPQINCYCPEQTDVWQCYGPYPSPPYFDPPESVPGERTIAELDDAERTELCTWFVTIMVGGPEYPLLSDRPVDGNGYVSNLVCTLGDYTMPCNAMLPGISVAQCAQNLALSECEAPVSAFTSCIASVSNVGGTCSPIGEGCFDYFDVAGCDGTIAQELRGPPGSDLVCRVRVE
jgi:hypothetical protein